MVDEHQNNLNELEAANQAEIRELERTIASLKSQLRDAEEAALSAGSSSGGGGTVPDAAQLQHRYAQRIHLLEEQLEQSQASLETERADQERERREDKAKLKTLAKHYQMVAKAKEGLEDRLRGYES
jgi:hypothetical protein